ncbi:DUF3108 domain-containing protein [Rheinheimera maricola]|uniref:DUF3108 domain-containing protein n=1 Tax=Rheinheimera maricola TaxID=2793282 RepID=A0ABS7XCE1_9GAMM|nr:DUF3108 domain-containing protein [Rheinheimera maricola]MBZ9612735.1 DUF3108 domain-containing protein [Rheinheimera maricola]
MMMKINWRFCAPFIVLATLFCSAASADVPPLSSFNADYVVYRAGKKHGEANRYLKLTEQGYQLGYSSDISWMIFSDKRSETSDFTINNGQIQPLRYILTRSGSGPNRYYELNLNPDTKVLTEGKSRKPKAVEWHDDWQDQISYQLQLALDLKAGKTEFSYNVLNRNGNSKLYHYKVVAEEKLPLPYGNINTLRIARVEANSDKQIYAWVAPELDYMLVRLWRGEDNVEQFDVQLHKLDLTPQVQANGSP